MKLEMLETFLTGHKGIDDDHRKLVDIINLISDAIASKDEIQCEKLLDTFLELAENHFHFEEGILREIGFPGLYKHCEYHKELLERAHGVKKLCVQISDSAHLNDCFNEMASFLIDDIVKGDHEFISYLISAGVAVK